MTIKTTLLGTPEQHCVLWCNEAFLKLGKFCFWFHCDRKTFIYSSVRLKLAVSLSLSQAEALCTWLHRLTWQAQWCWDDKISWCGSVFFITQIICLRAGARRVKRGKKSNEMWEYWWGRLVLFTSWKLTSWSASFCLKWTNCPSVASCVIKETISVFLTV